MKGNIPDDESGGTIRVDMILNKRGECAGTLGMDGMGEAELVKTGGTLYMKYDAEFLRSQSEGEPKESVDATVALLAGKWTKMSAEGPDAEDFAGFCDLGEVFDGARGGNADATRGRPPRSTAHPRSRWTRRTAPTTTRCTSPPRASRTCCGSTTPPPPSRGPLLQRLRQAGPGAKARRRRPGPRRAGLTLPAAHHGNGPDGPAGNPGPLSRRTAPASSAGRPSSPASRT
ncbi:hypothetical protein SHKM778_85910 [Streptomyces sp. KM77-8]|uniref:Uncharacterized protein n=1 Tax=Streptomyces haneummycinicus TaxID=3074435 RepID=A0AAT9HZ26_9ACTN